MMDLVRILIEFIAPLPISMVCMFLGGISICLNRQKLSYLFLFFGLGILIFCGYGFYFVDTLHDLERKFSPFVLESLSDHEQARIRYIVVLGSGHVSDPTVTPNARIGGSSLYRLVEGVSLLRSLPQARLVLSGGRVLDPVANAQVVKQVALGLGVEESRIIMEDRPLDTIAEAELLAPLLGTDPFILVTSAAHMARAVQLFNESGTKPLPAPTDYITKRLPGDQGGTWAPSCRNLEIAKRLIYEWLGTVWGHLKSR